MAKATLSWLHVSPGFAMDASSQDHRDEVLPTTRVNGKTVRMFQCLFCDKAFLKPQALGGHQTCHRRERSRFRNEPYNDRKTTAIKAAPSCHSGTGVSMGTSIASRGGHTSERWGAGVPPFALLEGCNGVAGWTLSQSGATSVGKPLDLELHL